MEIERIREEVRQMRDCTFTASNGVRVTIDCSLLRAMPEHEKSARRARFDRLAQELRLKYAQG